MTKHPIWYLVIAIAVLVLPTLGYLIWLVPQLSERYQTLLASGGIIGGSGYYASSLIPEKTQYGTFFKTAARSFTTCVVCTIVSEFAKQIALLVIVFIISYTVFRILVEAWKGARRRKENNELATEIARNIDKNIK